VSGVIMLRSHLKDRYRSEIARHTTEPAARTQGVRAGRRTRGTTTGGSTGDTRMTLLIPHPCTRREHYEKWGEYGDRLEYGLPAGAWRAAKGFCRGRA
jgi:hypothetical protein